MLLASASSASAASEQNPNVNLPVYATVVGKQPVSLQIARTQQEQEYGLMYRQSMPENQGMLFAYPHEEQLCFWMKNTRLPLTIAFADSNRVITDIIDMEPYDLSSHCASKPVQYALEMNRGWFQRHQVRAGDKLFDTIEGAEGF